MKDNKSLIEIVILTSTKGGICFSLQEKIKNNLIKNVRLKAIITDNNLNGVFEKATSRNETCYVIDSKVFSSKIDYEKKLLEILLYLKPDLIILAGYMKILGKEIINQFENKIINTHPSLLPAFPGKNSVKKAFEHGVKVFGATIHYVDEGIDTGKIIKQRAFEVKNNYNLSEIKEKINNIEVELLSEFLCEFSNNFQIS